MVVLQYLSHVTLVMQWCLDQMISPPQNKGWRVRSQLYLPIRKNYILVFQSNGSIVDGKWQI